MTISYRARTALAVLAIAASLIGTTVPTSALAAQTGPGTRPTPNIPGPVQPPPRYIPPLPDVSVKMIGSNGSNLYPSFLDVEFDLQTTGADANNVALRSQCIYHSYDDQNTRYEDEPIKQLSLSASWPVPVPFLVTCTPQANELVATVTEKADVPAGDSNPSNNFAYWDHLTWK